MANTFYYGSCNSTAEKTVKQVVIQGLPAEIRDESFLQFGDMISVTFTYGNDAENPTIKLYNGSLDNEIGVSGDDGHFIKTQRLNGSISGLWNSGDICGFTYTIIGDACYWVLANDGIASGDSYGKVKIANDISDISEADAATTAITVKAARELIAAQPIGTLSYSNAVGETGNNIGTLVYTRGDEEPTELTIQIPSIPPLITHTHELDNDGEVEGGDGFITRKLDTTINFAGPVKGITVYDEENEVEHLVYEAADVNGDATLKSLNDLNINVANDLNIETINDFNIETANDLNIETVGDLKVISSQNLMINTEDVINIAALTSIGLYGSDVTIDHDIQYNLDITINSETGVITGTDKNLYEAIQRLGWNDILQG